MRRRETLLYDDFLSVCQTTIQVCITSFQWEMKKKKKHVRISLVSSKAPLVNEQITLKANYNKKNKQAKARESHFTANQTQILSEHVTGRKLGLSDSEFHHEHQTLLGLFEGKEAHLPPQARRKDFPLMTSKHRRESCICAKYILHNLNR